MHIVIFAGQSRPSDTFSPPNPPTKKQAPPQTLKTRDSITKCKIFVLNSHHIFDARDLMADWGWGFTNPQPLPNPILSRAKGNFQLAIQKKETEVSLRLTNFVLQYV